jgi:hypothetical protein
MSMGALIMANGGLTFLLLPFQYLVGWGIFNLVISMNLFRLQQFESYQRRSLLVRHLVGRSAGPLGRILK